MSGSGKNLPDYRDAQLAFSAHIRNPDIFPCPTDIEPSRMDVYVGLFYRNIESFVASAYPVFKSCLEDQVWDDLVREFVHQHESESPYFLEISQEFLAFLDGRGLAGLPAFALELTHYEWVELALDVAEGVVEPLRLADDEPLPALELSALALPLSYNFLVHTIGPDHQPEAPAPEGCFLIACRQANDKVKFIESNPLTHRLLDLIAQGSVADAVAQLHQELCDSGRDVDKQQVEIQAIEILRRLIDASAVTEKTG